MTSKFTKHVDKLSINDNKICNVDKVNSNCKIVKKQMHKLDKTKQTKKDFNINNKDIIFSKFKEYKGDDADKIDDFLYIFYYLIVCYSKRCFKYDGNWTSHNKLFKLNIPFNFDYELSNKTNTHSKLLYIQKQMFKYRQEYTTFNNLGEKILFTPEYCDKFINFVNESLILFINEIIKPIKHISPIIMQLILKYGNLESMQNTLKKSKLINYTALEQFTNAINNIV